MYDVDETLSNVTKLLVSIDELERKHEKVKPLIPESLSKIFENEINIRRTLYTLMSENLRTLKENPEKAFICLEKTRGHGKIMEGIRMINEGWWDLVKEYFNEPRTGGI